MGFELSRRKLIRLGGAAALSSKFMTGQVLAEPETSKRLSVSDREVSFLGGLDSGFGAAIETLYPGLQNDPVFRELSPLTILVTQQAGPGIRAYTIAWTIVTPTGGFTTPLFSYIAPGSKSKGRSVSTVGSAQRDILQTGQSRLVTPFFNWTPTYYQNNSKPNWDTLLGQIEPGAFLVSELQRASEITVSLDAVVFSDWKAIGPDHHHLRKFLRCTRNAEHDEATVVHKLLQEGASDNVIVETLQAHATAQRSSKKNRYVRSYEQARRFQAQVLLRCFGDADRDTFTKAVRRLRMRPRTVVKKVIA